ncbi:hypothetical protein NC653_029684 [Populus alba x Populus x berolinensis]|uniref:Uncharacterized protein n=1 Tax=Populus alba x Populus x berolinensis TaxID=444605 RepID=A0AAD6M361_9ROSI|nr:hypothetical protein NC653_029684 [Populus alba x Populus x berolinensis]
MKIKVDMLAVLGNNQIKAGGFYSRSTIEEAFKKKFDTTGFGVKCFWKEGKRRLIEIKFCNYMWDYFCNIGAADLILSLGSEYVTVFYF